MTLSAHLGLKSSSEPLGDDAQRIRIWPDDRPLAAIVDAAPNPGWAGSFLGEPIETRDGSSLASPYASTNAGTPTAPGRVWIGALPYTLAPLADDAVAAAIPPANFANLALWTMLRADASPPDPCPPDPSDRAALSHTLGPIDTARNRGPYLAGVRECIRLIREGDAFQINLAHRLSAQFSGSARSLFADLLERAKPGFAAYIERPGLAILSLSPELFLEFDAPTRRVISRPMKGTRPLGDPRELEHAEKDRAELAMIVDLMRNDLGRVCDLGSVRVEQTRRIETHGQPDSGVYQATALVSGRLRDDRTTDDLLRAAFPPGSVTGAPKVRATQIIQDLEHATGLGPGAGGRGYYCGSIALARPDGSLTASVAIRTITIRGETDPGRPGHFQGARLDLPVGAGIVADSDPDAEWLETLHKARSLVDLELTP